MDIFKYFYCHFKFLNVSSMSLIDSTQIFQYIRYSISYNFLSFTGGLFGQQQQPTSAFGQSASNSPFGMSSATTTTASLSTPLISSTTTTPATSSNPFQKSNDPFAQKSSSGVGGGLFGKKVEDQLDDSIYSLIEALSAQELDAFKAPSFTLGLIPEKPPPKELCV